MKDSTIKLKEKFLLDNQNLYHLIDDILEICNEILNAYKNGNKVMVCGNGGSAADGEHIVGELMKGFVLKRPLDNNIKSKLEEMYGEEGTKLGASLQQGLPAISLNVHSALMSAFENDVDPEYVYAQQVMGYGKEGDVLIGLSTSGNAKNVAAAFKIANAIGVKTISMTGKDGGVLKDLSTAKVIVNENETYKIQEEHIKIYHFICLFVENELFES